jgi:ubiquinone/menaquinone biosynthesis C-methylase UbiE
MRIDEKQTKSLVKDWYTKQARQEWRRLQQDPYHQIEFIVTMHFLKKYLPKNGLILDAGGGPGRYTIELAEQGYDVILMDFVPEMLKIAARKIKKARVQKRVKRIVEGSIEDLSMFDTETFDAVLCLGAPLCHVLNVQKREKSTAELVRAAKKKSPIFVSVISRIGLLKSILIRFPHELKYARYHLDTADYVPGVQGEGFTATHWFLPEELRELLEKHGANVAEMAGLEGLSSHFEKETNRLFKDQQKWKIWMDIILKTCTYPSVVGSAEHFLAVGMKNA